MEVFIEDLNVNVAKSIFYKQELMKKTKKKL